MENNYLKKPIGQITPTTQQPQSAIQSSFNSMIGGGMPSLGALEAASMRLADAASKRKSSEFFVEREAALRDQKRLEIQSSIAKNEQELNALKNSPVGSLAEQRNKNQRIADLKNSISRAKSDLRNLDASEKLAALNIG